MVLPMYVYIYVYIYIYIYVHTGIWPVQIFPGSAEARVLLAFDVRPAAFLPGSFETPLGVSAENVSAELPEFMNFKLFGTILVVNIESTH